MNTPGISVVVAVLNGIQTVQECLTSLRAQDYAGPVELIFVDGGSTDGTREFLAGQGIAVVMNHDGLAASRNAGIVASHEPFIAFTDVDCVLPAFWLTALMTCYQLHAASMKDLAGVGGGNRDFPDGRLWTAALGMMKQTFLGSNGSVYGTSFKQDKPVDHIATINALFVAEVLHAHHFLRCLSPTGEDAELSWRLHTLGYSFMYCANADIIHHMRSTPWLWACRMFDYGIGRLRVMSVHPQQFFFKSFLLAPMALVLVCVLTVPAFFLHGPYFSFILALLYLYLGTMGIQSAVAVWRAKRPLLFLHVLFAFIVTHVAYGLGMWRRLLFPFS